jgi:ribosome-associated translation inhibitor RaiA
MLIHINTDGNITAREKLVSEVEATVTSALGHLGERITRVEVHLNDVSGHKGTPDSTRCMMEARLAGRQPVAVTHHATALNEAVDGAAEKLKHLLDSTLGRVEDNHHARETVRHTPE